MDSYYNGAFPEILSLILLTFRIVKFCFLCDFSSVKHTFALHSRKGFLRQKDYCLLVYLPRSVADGWLGICRRCCTSLYRLLVNGNPFF